MNKRKALPIAELFAQFNIRIREGQMYVMCIVDGMLEDESEDDDEDFSFPAVFIEV